MSLCGSGSNGFRCKFKTLLCGDCADVAPLSSVVSCKTLLCGDCCKRICVTTCLALPDISQSLTQVCLLVYT